jgi:hypothetical protein
MQSRRLDALINLLFGHILSFFMYNMYRKRNGLVKNIMAEEIAISSLHLAQFELKNAKVFAALIPCFCSNIKGVGYSGSIYVLSTSCLSASF